MKLKDEFHDLDTKFKGKSYDLELWPCDWVAESEVKARTILLRGLFKGSLVKITHRVQELNEHTWK